MREDELDYMDREILLSAGFEEDIPDRTLNKILKALKEKKPIEAIKIYREVTGVDLRDAKNAIDTARVSLARKEKKIFAKELESNSETSDNSQASVDVRKKNKLTTGFLILLVSLAIAYGLFTFSQA